MPMKHGINCWGVKREICFLGAEVVSENVMGSEDGQWRGMWKRTYIPEVTQSKGMETGCPK